MNRPMTHDDVQARLSAHMDDALAAGEAREVEAHLAACSQCAAHLAELRSTVAILREVAPVPAPDGFTTSVRARLEQPGAARPLPIGSRILSGLPRMQRSWRTAAAAAAIVVVGVFAVNVMRDRRGEDGVDAVAPGADRQLESADSRGARLRSAPGEARPSPQAPAAAQPAPVAQGSQSAGDQAAPPPTAEIPRRYLIRTGKVVVEVEVFDDAARRMQTIADAAGGFVSSSSVAEGGGGPRGTFVIRVPARRFGDATREIEALGRVRMREYQTEDVGEEYVDIEARLRNLQRQEARLLSFMDRASRVPDLVALESEVSRVRGEIERLTGRQRYLANRIDLATIAVTVSQQPKKRPGGFWDIDRTIARVAAAFLGAVRQVLLGAEAVVAFVASAIPAGGLVALGWLGIRRALRRRP